MNRRGFVVGGVLGAATVAFSLVRVAIASPAPAGNAAGKTAANAAGKSTGAATVEAESAMVGDMPGMVMPSGPATTHAFHYQGHAVQLTESAEAASLVIDGRHPIHLERPAKGQYHTHLLPFTSYTDSKLLVRDVLTSAASHLFIV